MLFFCFISYLFFYFCLFKCGIFQFLFFIYTDDDPKSVNVQYLITKDICSANFGDLNQIINFDDENICIKFETIQGWYEFILHQMISELLLVGKCIASMNQSNANFFVCTALLFSSAILDAQKVRSILGSVKKPQSVFSQRTEESSASQYFQFYGYLSQQQNMMQDYVRTSTYQKAILNNLNDFKVSRTHNAVVTLRFYAHSKI